MTMPILCAKCDQLLAEYKAGSGLLRRNCVLDFKPDLSVDLKCGCGRVQSWQLLRGEGLCNSFDETQLCGYPVVKTDKIAVEYGKEGSGKIQIKQGTTSQKSLSWLNETLGSGHTYTAPSETTIEVNLTKEEIDKMNKELAEFRKKPIANIPPSMREFPAKTESKTLPGKYGFTDKLGEREVTFTFQTLEEMRSFWKDWREGKI